MNDTRATENSVEESAGENGSKAGGGSGRPIQAIKEDFSNTVGDIKNRFGLLLDLRDRKIKQLEEKLAKGVPPTTKARLLIVDDAESTSQIVGRYLHGQPVEIVSATGHEALEHVHAHKYDAILLEAVSSIQAGVDGLSLCQELCEKGNAAKVVVMSSRPGDRIKNLAEDAGAGFLRKPFKREHVVQLLRNILSRKVE